MCSLFGLPAVPRCRSVLLVVPKSIIVVSVFPTPTPFFRFLATRPLELSCVVGVCIGDFFTGMARDNIKTLNIKNSL